MTTMTSTTTPAGSRRAIRRAVSLPCEVVSSGRDEPLSFRAVEMSTGGMWLQTARPLRTGEPVVVCFRPDDASERELMVFAEIVRVSTSRGASDDTVGAGMGLELIDLTPAERARIERWLVDKRGPIPRRRRPVAARRKLPSSWR